MAVMVKAMPPTSLVKLINEWGTVPRAVSGEQEHPFPSTQGFILGLPEELIHQLDTDALQCVADRFHSVFTNDTPAGSALQVTKILITTGVRPVVTAVHDEMNASWAVDESEQALAAAAALALREHYAKHGLTRLGVCSGRNCADVYIDASPTRDRRYCSITCQNRARAAAFRSRHSHNKKS